MKKALLSIPVLLLIFSLSACEISQKSSGVDFGSVASDSAAAAPSIADTSSADTSSAETSPNEAASDKAETPNINPDETAPGAGRSNGSAPALSNPGSSSSDEPQASAPEISDPFEPINTRVLDLNEAADHWVVRPVVSGYVKVVPAPARAGVGRVFNNAAVIPRFANALFQLRLQRAEIEAMRFGINSTLGLAGWYDLAYEWFGLQAEDNDFGLTLAKYGVGTGPYLMLPILGPSSVRDVIGLAADGLMDPVDYVAPASAVYYKYAAKALQAVNARAQNRGLLEYLDTYSIDKYGAIQDAYLQRRQKQTAKVTNASLQVHLRTPAEASDW